MNDLISRKSAMLAFAERVKDSNNSDFVSSPTWNDAVDIIEKLPNVERRGQWKISYDLAGLCYLECSECGLNWVVDDSPEDNEMFYCPRCGARMEIEK